MKRFVVALALTLVSLNVLAQNVNKASRLLGRDKIQDAKEIVDEAIVSEDTKTEDKTWFVRGDVYMAIANAEEAEVKALADTPKKTAAEAYRKAMELAEEGSKYSFLAEQKLTNIYAEYFNKGVESYQANDYVSAANLFAKASEIKPADTTALLYAATAANQGEMWEKALEQYNGLLETNYSDREGVYNNMLYIQRAVLEDQDAALKTVRKAKEEYPANMDYAKQEINILIITDRIDEAMTQINAEIAKNPDEASLYSDRAMLYAEMEELDKAAADYKKSLEINPDNFANNYFLGVLYYNAGAEYTQKANDMSLKEYQKNGAAVEEKAKAEFKKAMPYMEKAVELKPEDKNALDALKTIYGRLKMYDKAEALDQKMEDLGYYKKEQGQ